MTTNIGTYRPKTLLDIYGQPLAKQYLSLKAISARNTGDVPGHMLFLGPSGTGKTTFAEAFARELGGFYRKVMCGEQIKSKNDLIDILRDVRQGEVLFLDEIHMIKPAWQDVLYGAMEDRKITVISHGHPRIINLPKFMVIGATTHVGLLNSALLTRVQHKIQFVPYTLREMYDIIKSRAQNSYNLNLNDSVAYMLAKLSRGTPRIAANLLASAFDLSFAYGSNTSTLFTEQLVETLLKFEGIDPLIGLDVAGRAYLTAIASEAGAGMGVGVISAKTGLEESTIKETVEPFLMGNVELTYTNPTGSPVSRTGPLVKVGTKGRILTALGETYLTQIKLLQSRFGWFPGEII